MTKILWSIFVTNILWPKFVHQHVVTNMLWPNFVTKIVWPKCCDRNVVTKILWPKCCDQNFVTKILWLKCCDSQLPDNIFQPLKEQKWCPSLGAPNCGVNSECFAQKLRIWSKTPNFWVTKNSELMVTTKLVEIDIVLNYWYQLGGATLEICNFSPIRHLGFLGGQLKSVTLYVLRAAFCNLAGIFPPAHFLWHIFP